jgi:ion channel-forming bestrophin family protein
MILKENFDLTKVAGYIWKDMALAGVSSVVAYAVYHPFSLPQVALPFAPVAVLGSALAIFLAFRNNTSYARWVEGAQFWYAITTQSRIFARLIITFVHSHRHTQQYDPEQAVTFRQHMVRRQIAWVNALRLQLRGQDSWHELSPYLPDDEYAVMLTRHNKPLYLMERQGHHIYEAMAKGTLQGFDSFQLEGALAQLATQQSGCERLKAIPIPRQYDYFTRVFVYLFTVILPFCLLSLFTTSGSTGLIFPFALLITFLFATVERVGAVNEHPFENKITDVPMTAICNTIERDLLEMLEEVDLPAKLKPQAGYLY